MTIIDQLQFGAFSLELRENGVALVVFSRPPVNAVSLSVYEDIGNFADHVTGDDRIKVLIISAPDDARAWCGGADLREFEGMTAQKRSTRAGS